MQIFASMATCMRQPRGPIHEKLYAKVIINSAKIRVEYYTRDHELYSELTQEFER